MKSGLVSRGLPRSSATIENPVSPSSLARMPPFQPRPTMTMSTPLSRVAIVVPLNRDPGCSWARHRITYCGSDRSLRRTCRLRRGSRSSSTPPCFGCRRRADRRNTLHGGLQEHVEERVRRHLRKLRLALFDQLQGGDTVGRTELIERLAAMGFGNPGVEVGNADPIELRGGEGQLVPLLRCTRGDRPLHV